MVMPFVSPDKVYRGMTIKVRRRSDTPSKYRWQGSIVGHTPGLHSTIVGCRSSASDAIQMCEEYIDKTLGDREERHLKLYPKGRYG